ncbi:MAG: radical SAM family heme chaperone HemW, partial [Planctomycetales bacterium]|nr:radical SAM family heme chaperone HemW [Planctomycetales bacterium]
DDLADRYLDALERELQGLREPAPVATLFVGGGTPTHLSVSQLDRLCKLLDTWFPRPSDGEYSFEANPNDIDNVKVAVMADHGVTRVSLGAQSFHEPKLRSLDRDHAAGEILQAVNLLRPSIERISLDLIFGAPDESLEIWQGDLRQAIACAPDHISTYGLTFERGTAFWSQLTKSQLQEVDEETQRAMYVHGIETLAAAGYEHYEVSNFARPEARCRHNEAYWHGHTYYAVGAGASRYVDGRRETNHRSSTTYMRRVLAGESPTAESETLDLETRARERVVFGLRRIEGIDVAAISRDVGLDVAAIVSDQLDRFVSWGFLDRTGTRYRLTTSGLLVSDSLWPYLL